MVKIACIGSGVCGGGVSGFRVDFQVAWLLVSHAMV